MVSHCPSTSKAITERSDENGCDSKYRYHCMRTKQGSLTEQCLEISWIQDGNCAIYNAEAQRVDAVPCNENLGICPQKQYLSNDVTSYSACVNEPEVHVSSLGPTSHVFNVTTSSKLPSDGGRLYSTHLPLILVALIAVISIIVIIIIYMCRYRRSFRNGSSQATKKRLSDHEEQIALNTGTYICGKHKSTREDTRHAINMDDKKERLSDHEEAMPPNTGPDISGNRESTREKTRHDIDPYYKTKTYEHIEKLLEDSAVSILIVGHPGSGKSALVKMLNDKFCRKKIKDEHNNSIYMKCLEDVETHKPESNTRMIYIVEDCFEDWSQYPDLASQGKEKLIKVHEKIIDKRNCLIVTLSKWTYDKFLDSVVKAHLKQCKNLEVIDLSTKEFQLDMTDKTGILEFHRKKESTAQRMDEKEVRKVTDQGLLKSIASYLSGDTKLEFEFPLSCRLFYSHDSFVAQKEDFFNDTKKKIWKYVIGLAEGSLEEKNQCCTLIYTALIGGKIHSKKENLSYLKSIAKVANIDLHSPQFDFRCCLITQCSDYTYEVVHEEITKLLFHAFGFVYTTFVINICDTGILLKYMRTDDRVRKDDYIKNGLLILRNNMYDCFAKRLMNLDGEKRKHVIFKDETFGKKLREARKKPQKCETVL